MKNHLKIAYEEFIYGGHLQSIGAGGLIFVTASVFQGLITWHLPLIVYLIFYLLYLYNRYKEIYVDAETNPERTKHFFKYINIMPKILLGILGLISILVFMYSPNMKTIVFFLSLVIFGLLYTTYFKNLTSKIVGFKNFYVALFFAMLVYLYVFYYSYPLGWDVFLFAVTIYIKGLFMQALLDIKDIKSDKAQKLKTVATLFGKQKILVIATLSTTLFSVAAFYLTWYVVGNETLQGLIFLIEIPILVLASYLIYLDNKYGYIVISAEFFYLSLFSLILYFS